jgi:hypothetical protein
LFWGWSPDTLAETDPTLLGPVSDRSATDRDKVASDGGSIPSLFTDVQASLENVREGIERTIVTVSFSDLETVAKQAYRQIGEVDRFQRGLDGDYVAESNDVIGSAYFLYMDLYTLPTSVKFHDSIVSRRRELLGFEQHTGG